MDYYLFIGGRFFVGLVLIISSSNQSLLYVQFPKFCLYYGKKDRHACGFCLWIHVSCILQLMVIIILSFVSPFVFLSLWYYNTLNLCMLLHAASFLEKAHITNLHEEMWGRMCSMYKCSCNIVERNLKHMGFKSLRL